MAEPIDLNEAIFYCEEECRRLGLNKSSVEILLLCKCYGYERYEDLDLAGFRRLWVDLRRCEPSPGLRLRPQEHVALFERLKRLESRLGEGLREAS